MKLWTTTIAIVIVLAAGTTALAQCPAKANAEAQKATCHGEKATAKAACTEGGKPCCPLGVLAGQNVPKMVCKVGDKCVNCPVEAEKLAKAQNAKITYVVAEKEYCEQPAALEAYSGLLNEYLAGLTSVRYAVGDDCVGCPNAAKALAKEKNTTVKFRVASYTFESREDADEAARVAKLAADKVVMKKVVDGKEVACDPNCKAKACEKTCAAAGAGDAKGEVTAAGSGAKTQTVANEKGCDKSAKCEYVVAGQKTCCPVTAQVQLAAARIAAAQNAVREFAGETGAKVAQGA